MQFIELAKARYSARKYKSQSVEKDKLNTILEAGRVAPTAANKQPQRILVLQEKESLDKLGKTANVYGAPLAIIVCGDAAEAWERPEDKKVFADIDASVVATHMMVQAADLGLGSVWVGIFDPTVLKNTFNIPNGVEPVGVLAIGYADGEPSSPERHSTTRKQLKDTVAYESF